MESRPREKTCCCKCKDPPPGEIKIIIELKNSGLDIYVHKNMKDSKGVGKSDKYSFVLHNTGNKELKRPDYISEMCQYKTWCMKCKRLVSKVHSLMDKIEDIKKNQILGVCDYCSCRNKTGNCKRCEYVLNKYMSHRDNIFQRKKAKYLAWISKMHSDLQDILEKELSCKHKMYRDNHPNLVIDEIIRELKRIENPEPRSPKHRPTRDTKFPPIQEVLSRSRDIPHYTSEPEELVKVIKAYQPRSLFDSLQVKSSTISGCVCKYITDKMIKGGESKDDSTEKNIVARPSVSRGSKATALEKDIMSGKEIEIGATEYISKKGKYKEDSSKDYSSKNIKSKREFSEEEVAKRDKHKSMSSEEYCCREINRKNERRKASEEYESGSIEDIFRKKRRRRYSLDQDYVSRDRTSRRGWSDDDISIDGHKKYSSDHEYYHSRKTFTRDWSDEDISRRRRPKRYIFEDFTPDKGRSRKDYSDEYIKSVDFSKKGWLEEDIAREWYRRRRSVERIFPKNYDEYKPREEKYKKESPQEIYFKRDSSEEEIPLKEKPKKYVLDEMDAQKGKPKSDQPEDEHVLSLKTLKERSDEYLAYAKRERGTRKVQVHQRSAVLKKKKTDVDTLTNDKPAKIKSTKGKSKHLLHDSFDTANIPTHVSESNLSESENKQIKQEKKAKLKETESENMLLKLLKDRKMSREKKRAEKDRVENELLKTKKLTKLVPITSLPKIKKIQTSPVKEKLTEKPESFVEFGDSRYTKNAEMVRGTKIIPYDPHYKDKPIEEPPLLFKIVNSFHDEFQPTNLPILKKPLSARTMSEMKSKKSSIKLNEAPISTNGILRYALSDQVFIDKGVTVLPTSKTMRRMNIYKMKPANAHFDWFKHNMKKKEMFYDTGEKLAEIYANGNGKWFYRNGKVALDYYTATEQNVHRRYVIYSSGLEKDNGKPLPLTVLACFDHLGNGVVYDNFGNVRLKYNQTEGVVVDSKIGPPSRWKWHTLNDPPVLQAVIHERRPKHKDPRLDKIINESEGNKKQDVDPAKFEMLTVEFENFVQEKAHKILQKFKPFQIRIKAVKINEQFSLRVLDQANISLIFQDVPVCLKLHLGMQLISTEIIDVETAEISEVATPYDRFPARSQSVADIQKVLKRAKNFKQSFLPTDTKACKSHGTKTFDCDTRISIS